jgi:hypothetical protein
VGGTGEKWPQQCMHIWINEWRKKSHTHTHKRKGEYGVSTIFT